LYPIFGLTSEWGAVAAHAVVNSAGSYVINNESKILLKCNEKNSLLSPFFSSGEELRHTGLLIVLHDGM